MKFLRAGVDPPSEAREAYDAAIARTDNAPERALLARRRAELDAARR